MNTTQQRHIAMAEVKRHLVTKLDDVSKQARTECHFLFGLLFPGVSLPPRRIDQPATAL